MKNCASAAQRAISTTQIYQFLKEAAHFDTFSV